MGWGGGCFNWGPVPRGWQPALPAGTCRSTAAAKNNQNKPKWVPLVVGGVGQAGLAAPSCSSAFI